MLLKIIIVVFVIIILYCLGSGAYYLLRDGSGSKRLAKALTWRTVLSLSLFALLIFAYFMGWISPHGIRPPEWPMQ